MEAEFGSYRETVRALADELGRKFPTGYCIVVSVLNEKKNSFPGVKTECRVFDAARLITDGTAILFNQPEEVQA